MAKDFLKSNSETKRTWNYSLEGVEIGFTLRTDIKKELKAAIEILGRAQADFQEQLDSMPKGK